MTDKKTALEALYNISEFADTAHYCILRMLGVDAAIECPTVTCSKCSKAAFRAHVKGYAEKYPEVNNNG
jgi:hypothetical protein